MSDLRLLPHAAAMSQFYGGYTGACTWTARRACLHTLDPNRWPLAPAALVADVQKAIDEHIASPSGACTLVDIATSLDQWDHVPYQLHPYQEPWAMEGAGGWHELLTVTTGYGPVLLQVANGAAFGYESVLQYHAVAVLGIDNVAPWTFQVADSANPKCAGGGLVGYPLAQIAEARPCGALIPALPAAPPPPPPAPKPTFDFVWAHTQLSQAQSMLVAVLDAIAAAQG